MDKYDKAIEWLLRQEDFEDAVEVCWNWPKEDPAGCLFYHCTRSGEIEVIYGEPGESQCTGCLTQIRDGQGVAATKELTEAIRLDQRIPCCPEEITRESLLVFAEWQRRLDRELHRTIEETEDA